MEPLTDEGFIDHCATLLTAAAKHTMGKVTIKPNVGAKLTTEAITTLMQQMDQF